MELLADADPLVYGLLLVVHVYLERLDPLLWLVACAVGIPGATSEKIPFYGLLLVHVYLERLDPFLWLVACAAGVLGATCR